MTTTPTGVPIILCTRCGLTHPTTRPHCTSCGRPTAFTRPDGTCIHCTHTREDA